ncbi:DUF433 domain-containing protein [Mycobacterium botniense]|uniref:DUF433 domain-containing protein n=1 Tax=Mycobacterium botniense TaxID=84962 RepID=A0A7I9XXF7_9MYCO|nr:DUF433 domain-containing protein [Mycobacterium botniense]GFG74479.1 hypothetical protein MBOT_18440 [Mycobacterium botniense]
MVERAQLGTDERGEKYVAELAVDADFPDIVVNPRRYSGQPTFAGRRLSVETIAGMVTAGEREEDLAADYGLSIAQVREAVGYVAKHGRAA